MGWPYDDLVAKVYLPHFHKEGENALRFLVKGELSSRAFLSIYKDLDPIEKMAEVEKNKLKKSVIEMFPEKTPEQMVDACKIIYTIGVTSQFVKDEEKK